MKNVVGVFTKSIRKDILMIISMKVKLKMVNLTEMELGFSRMVEHMLDNI